MDDFEKARRFFIEGLKLLETNHVQAAEEQFARSLEIIPDRVSTLNNLSVIKIRLEKFAEAEELARKAVAAGDKSPEAWSNLGIALTATQRHEEALKAHKQALRCNPANSKAWLAKAMTLLELKRFDEALKACDETLKLNSGQPEASYLKSWILRELGRLEEAQKTYLVSLELWTATSPVFIADRRASQKAAILIISHDPVPDNSTRSFEALHRHQCPNYPGQIAAQLQDDFHFTFVFESIALKPSVRQRMPQPDILINNCANGELILLRGNISGLTELMDSFVVPVVNHPSKVVQTGRDTCAKLLQNIPGVVVPKTARFSAVGKTPEQLVEEIEAQFTYPLITRLLTAQKGMGMTKVDSRHELIEWRSSDAPKIFFVTEFVDSRKDDEFYRKLRAAFVGEEIIITRVDFDPNWKVHGGRQGRRVSFYLENTHLLEREKIICADPERELGRAALQALRAIRDRMPLDIFGIDFEVDAGGRVVFYEANATMNLLTIARNEVANPKEADDRLKQAFQRYLMSLAAGRQQKLET